MPVPRLFAHDAQWEMTAWMSLRRTTVSPLDFRTKVSNGRGEARGPTVNKWTIYWDDMLFILLATWLSSGQGFLIAPALNRCRTSRSPFAPVALATNASTPSELDSFSISNFLERSVASADGVYLRLNDSRAGAIASPERTVPGNGSSVGFYQITRPRWYNKAEATIIVLLVQRLQLLDARGVEHMLESVPNYRNANPVSSLVT